MYEKFLLCTQREDGIHGRCPTELLDLDKCLNTALRTFGVVGFSAASEGEWKNLEGDDLISRTKIQPGMDKASELAFKCLEKIQFHRFESRKEYAEQFDNFAAQHGERLENLDKLSKEELNEVFEKFSEEAEKNKQTSVKETVKEKIEDVVDALPLPSFGSDNEESESKE